MLKVEVIADPSCPWCLVGWKALARARDLNGALDFDRAWRPYLLFPRMPPEGIDRAAFYEARRRENPERMAASRRALDEAAIAAGLTVDFSKPAIMPAVIDAHRLILWAAGQGKGETAADAVLDAFWLRGEDIGARDVLIALGREIGLDGALVGDLLAGEADRDTVLAQHMAAQRGGVSGVPTTLYGRRLATQGAQSAEQHADAIRSALG